VKVGYFFIPLAPYLLWLVWAALRFPLPLSYNLRSLWQRKVGSLTTGLAIAVVVAIFVVVLSLSQGISKAFVSSGRADQLLVLRPNARTELNSGVERERVRILKTHPMVAQDDQGPLISAEAFVVVMLDKADGDGGTNVAVRGMEPAGVRMRPQVRMVEGRWFKPGLPEIVVPRRMQQRFAGLALGRTLAFAGQDWTVVGLTDAGGSAFESEIWADAEELMRAKKRSAFNSVIVRLQREGQMADFKAMLEEDRRLKLEGVAEVDYFAQQTEAGKPIQVLGNLITVILTLGAVFAAMNTMYASVAGRTSEIGTLRALGYRRREILASFQWEAVLLCGSGGLLGACLALAFNGIQTGTTNFQTFSDVSFAFTITPGLMLQGVAFSVLMGLLGGFLPAWRASRIPVTEAMKG